MPRSNGTKKSAFPAQITLPSDAYFDYVSGGANYRMTSENLISALGATGTLVSDGGVSDFDVLDSVGSTKNIRKLKAGTGISIGVDANNALELSQNFTFNAVGAELVDDPLGEALAFRSVIGLKGITVTDEDGKININNDAPFFSNSVVVSSLADFPDPVLTVITLEDDTLYLLDGPIDIGANTIVLGENTAIRGYGAALTSITTSSSGTLFTATKSFILEDFAVSITNGTVFACTGSAFESAYIKQFTVNNATSLGTFTTWYSLFWDKGACATFTNPLNFSGACNILIMDLVSFITGYTTAVNLGTATFNTLTFNRCGFNYASATNHIIAAASSANINAGKEGRLIGNTFDSGATNIVANFTAGDLRWLSISNLNLPKTTRNGQMYMHTTNVTTIGGGSGDAGNPIKVSAATDWVSAHADQFEVNTNGRLTYKGQTTTEFMVTCSISGTGASSSHTFEHLLAKNGTVIEASRVIREYTSTAIGSPAVCQAIVTLSTDDYIELFVENTTGTVNWSSDSLNMIICEV